MIRSVPVCTQVYNHLFPFPQEGQPSNWQDHVKKNLVPEIRLEVHQFYGEESRSMEGKYPGIDYNKRSHRLRLRRYCHHRRLFRALDALNLTAWEIFSLCDWEGTLLVKGRFETQQGITLRDTTGDDISRVVPSRLSLHGHVIDEQVYEEEENGFTKEEAEGEIGEEEEEEEEDHIDAEISSECDDDEVEEEEEEADSEMETEEATRSLSALQNITVSVMRSGRLGMLNSGASTPASAAT